MAKIVNASYLTFVSLILISCLLVPIDTTFAPRFFIDLSADYTNFDYSADHSLLGLSSDTKLSILNGNTLKQIQ